MASDCFAAAAPFVSWADLADDVFVDDEAAEELAAFVAGALSADPEPRAAVVQRLARTSWRAAVPDDFVAGADFFAAGPEPLLLPADASEVSSERPSK